MPGLRRNIKSIAIREGYMIFKEYITEKLIMLSLLIEIKGVTEFELSPWAKILKEIMMGCIQLGNITGSILKIN